MYDVVSTRGRFQTFILAWVAAGALACTHAPTATGEPPLLDPPVAHKEPKVDVVLGQRRVDDYFWLRKKDSPEVLHYLAAENSYTEAVMKPTLALQDRLYHEMLGRIKETDLDVPVRRGGYFYYSRTEQGKQYPIHCRKVAGPVAQGSSELVPTGPEMVVLDLNEIGKREKFVGLGAFELTDDGNSLAYGLDTTGFRQYMLHVRDLTTGRESAEQIPRVNEVAFARDGKTLFYVVEDEQTKRPFRLLRHVIGTDPTADKLLFEEKDEMFDLDVERSRSKDFIIATSVSKTTSEVRVLRADTPTADFRVVAPRKHDHRYFVDHRGDRFFIRTDSGGRNFRLVSAPITDPGPAHWTEIVPHRADVMLEAIAVFRDNILLEERKDGLPQLRVLAGAKFTPSTLEFSEPTFSATLDQNPEFDQPAFRFEFQSPVTPRSVYDCDFKTGARHLLKRTEVPTYDPNRYATARIHIAAADGTQIPVSLLHRKTTTPDGSHPLVLYGYGSYGMPLDPIFSPNVFSLVDRGAVFAVAHIRGGGELGKRWHDEGRMQHKMNTFTDFIAAAEGLIKAGWAARDKIAIRGGSAGGLLMGAVTNLRPDLWRAVVAEVPFVDVINTMLDESLPLTVSEFEEWGNPKNKADYDYMMAYSPYDNVAAKAYPTMLVLTSYNDSQVMYWEPAKYVAKLRALKTDRNPLVFKINMEPAGHGGQSGRYNRLRESAFTSAFILRSLGLADVPPA